VSQDASSREGLRRTSAHSPRVFDRQENQIFFTAVENTPVPTLVTDPHQTDNPIIFVNKAFLDTTGYDADDLIGHNCRLMQGPETDPAAIREIHQALAGQRPITIEILNYRKNGSSFWNTLSVSPVFDHAGQIVYFLGSQNDITRHRDTEDALRQAQKMEAIGQLTGGIAHDFNNLLQIISGYLDVLDSGLNKPVLDVEKQRRGLTNMRAATDRAAALTQQLLTFARKQKPEGRTLNLNALLDGMDALIKRTIRDDTALTNARAPDLWNCRIDPRQAEIAILNVLINAHDAMTETDKKPRIHIETFNRTIDGDYPLGRTQIGAGRYICLAVTDNGTGIPAAIADRVMEPFFTTKDNGTGSGLGLSLVYGFAKQSGGGVELTSRENEGTIITILLPASDDAVPAPTPTIRIANREGSETVLVVDDRREIADIAAAVLEDSGYATHVVYGAAEALNIIGQEGRIDLLFTDMIMPGGHNGVALAEEARKLRPDLRVLITTGYAEGALEIMEGSGATFDVLPKPYKRSELLDKVRLVLDGPGDGA
jgi:PAS domain S-box-containing protein